MRLVPNAVLFAHTSTIPLPQEHVKWDVDRESNSKKLSDLFERKDELMREMRHQMHVAAWFRRWPAVAWFARRVEVASTMAFWLAILINFLILGCYQVKRCTACAMCCHRTDTCMRIRVMQYRRTVQWVGWHKCHAKTRLVQVSL